jgi:uncharacterized protein DUF998
MRHPRADIAVTTGPRVIGPGLAVLPPLPRMLFWIGYVTEQILVVNVRGFGLVLISDSHRAGRMVQHRSGDRAEAHALDGEPCQSGQGGRLEHRSWKRSASVLGNVHRSVPPQLPSGRAAGPWCRTLATMSPGESAPNVTAVRNVPWWGLLSSGAAPVLMVGGLTVATGLQPRSVDPMAETVSALAAVDAAERWVMTVTFLAVGVCYIATGLALRPAGAAGRLILVAGAGVGMLVAAFPQPADGGSLLHAIWASAGFCALTVWPAAAWRRGPRVPWALRPAVCAIAAAMLVLLLAWFAAEVVTGGGHAGLAERTLGVAQAVWPLTVVLSCRHLARAASAHPPAPPEPAAA